MKNHSCKDFWPNFKTYYLVEAVHSSLQETDFKVKNTFEKKYYFSEFSVNLELIQHILSVKMTILTHSTAQTQFWEIDMKHIT